MTDQPFALRLAPHISFGGLDRPLFRSLVGSSDPVACIEWAAASGFCGVQDPMAVLRSPDDQRRTGDALRAHDMEGGCFIHAPPQDWERLWISREQSDFAALATQIDEACATARRIASRHIAVLAPLDPDSPVDGQKAALADNLKRLSPRVADNGLIFCLEAVNARRVPGLLLNHVLDAHAVVLDVNDPSCRLIFDYGHVQAMDGDILHHLDRVWDEVAVVQIADNPGRVEPGMGELNFARLFADLIARGWFGLCELEHGWADETRDAARAYMSRLGDWCGMAQAGIHSKERTSA